MMQRAKATAEAARLRASSSSDAPAITPEAAAALFSIDAPAQVKAVQAWQVDDIWASQQEVLDTPAPAPRPRSSS